MNPHHQLVGQPSACHGAPVATVCLGLVCEGGGAAEAVSLIYGSVDLTQSAGSAAAERLQNVLIRLCALGLLSFLNSLLVEQFSLITSEM